MGQFENTVKLLSENSGLPESDVAFYLKFIKAPDNFKNGQAAVIGINRLLSAPHVQDLIESDIEQLIIINATLDTALRNSPALVEFSVPADSSPAKLGHGMLTTIPEYTVLFYDSRHHRDLIEQMKQLVLVEHAHATLNDRAVYCRFLRILSEKTVPQFIVERFPKSEVTAEDIYKILSEFVENELQNQTDAYQANLVKNAQNALRYLKVVVGRKVIRRSSLGESKIVESRQSFGIRGFSSLGEKAFVKYLTTPDEDEPYESGIVRSIVDLEIDKNVLRELEAQGVEPAELENEKYTAWFLDIVTPLYAQKFRARIKIKGRAASIIRQNQYLPLNVHLINKIEANLLLKFLETCEVKTKLFAAQILTLYVMLLTSSPFERAKSIILCFDNDDVPQSDEFVGYNFKTNVWIIPRLALPFATKEEPLSNALKPLTQITLPIKTKRIQELIGKYFRPEKARTKPLARMGFNKASIGSILKTVNDRLTPAKVSDFLMTSLAVTTSLSVAGYLFNRALAGSLARYYYSSHPQTWYQKIYHDLLLGILPAGQIDFHAQPHEIEPQTDDKNGFGARYVPSTKSVKETLQSIRQDLSGNVMINEKHAFIAFHNIFTLYSIYAQSLLTGIRAVIDPFIGSHQVIDSSGIAIFRDKDSDDKFHSRILPLHPLAFDIAIEYERHCQIIFEKMLFLDPLFCRNKILEKNSTFLIQPKTFHVLETRPSQIKNLLERYSDLPINSNRKFLRSFLEREGAIPEVIDATLGHASMGEPIGDTMSTFSFVDLKNQLFPLLDKLIEETGLKLLKGLTA
ncbi:hypothetical protein [Alishewanella longhuensis]